MPPLLIAGLPGAGKSSYCRWLVQNHGYSHIDSDAQPPDPLMSRLGDARPGVVRDNARLLQARGRDVVLDWGFPPHLLPVVRGFGDEGIALWWFGGDESAARESFARRDTVPMSAWRVQMQGIHSHWNDISEVFQGHMLDVVAPGPTHLPQGDIYRHMFPPPDD